MVVQLRRLGPNRKVKILNIPQECRRKIWLAGRGSSCQIYTQSNYASRRHFAITYREQNYFISDLQSFNGTFLNDEKLNSEKLLTFGSLIGVGVPISKQDSPDCIVYVFEAHTEGAQNEVQGNNTNYEEASKTSSLTPQPVNMDVDHPSHHMNDSQNINKNSDRIDTDSNGSSSSDVVLIEPPFLTDGPTPAKIRKLNESKVLNCLKTEPEPVSLFVSEPVPEPVPKPVPLTEPKPIPCSSTDVGLIKPPFLSDGPTPSKIRKLNKSEVINFVKTETKPKPVSLFVPEPVPEPVTDKDTVKNACAEDEDIFAYEAPTQVDEPQIKPEPMSDLLNYSLTETPIEISDSEDDLSPDLKGKGNKSPEGDEDEDIVVLETIIRSKQSKKNDFVSVSDCEIVDELTETDKKWMGRLLKVKKEEELLRCDNETYIIEDDESEAEDFEDLTDLFTEKLSELSKESEQPAAETLPRPELPQKIIKKVLSETAPKKSKSVRFDLVPQIRYIQVCPRSQLSPSERGRLRFSKIIFDICNWNSHWLEECKRVAPEKDPPDICSERLRKIPKKFPNHSDYMVAFIPAMLLNLWNKIRNKWMDSGESGFKQTVACDSYEDFQTESLSVFKCTGLAQDVNAHKQLIREGHLVLLRMHQVPNPQSMTTDRYSKKIGYLVFGFVESRIYERFDHQRLHQSLAERCASVAGDLHLVRLTILVKKRPNFQLDKRKLIHLTVLQQISQEIKMFKGICFLPDSPLCKAVLKPTTVDRDKLNLPERDNEELVFKGPLDAFQSDIIRDLSQAFNCTSSLLFSIHGAAGTGKGQIIIGLILQLLYGNKWREKRPKILFCSPWSIPLDEMVVRLKHHRQNMADPFSIVRVGPIKEVKPEVRHLCLSNLASNLRNLDKRNNADGRKFDAEIEVIKEADVICTTCVSSGISKMCAAFEKLLAKDKNKKVICIIDEANSSREPDSLIPLMLGVTHLLLVGDIYQLEPTFSGGKIHSVGFDNSLFKRVFQNFSNMPKDLWPIYLLKTQYRMNWNLSKFTSQLVYNTVLQKPIANVLSNSIENVKCFLFLVDRTPENLGLNEKEERESQILSQLVTTVKKITKTGRNSIRFAVITCSSKQTENLQLLLNKREYPEVEIGIIQSFQGREFDVVFFVYDGKKISSSYLATAFTRARCCLFIFTSEQAINGNSLFLKMADIARRNRFFKYVQPHMTDKDWEDVVTGV